MKKTIALLGVFLLILTAGCIFEGDEENTYEDGGKGKITAEPALWKDSKVARTYIPYPSYFVQGSRDMYAVFNHYGAASYAMMYQFYFHPYYGPTYIRWDNPFSAMGYLHLQKDGVGSAFPRINTVYFEDTPWGEAALPVQTIAGVQVERKIYVPDTGSSDTQDDFIRWLEILTNNTPDEKEVDVVVGGRMNFKNPMIFGTSDGDLIPEKLQDEWVVQGASYNFYYYQYPYVGHLFQGTLAEELIDRLTVQPASGNQIFDFFKKGKYDVDTATMSASENDVIMQWRNVELAPGETKVLMHYEILTKSEIDFFKVGGNKDDAVAATDYIQGMPGIALEGMDKDEINAVVNFPAAAKYCNVRGTYGSARAGALMTAINLRTTETQSSYAMPDGSFGVCIDLTRGDEVLIMEDNEAIRLVKAE
jgi:hypothetical protein